MVIKLNLDFCSKFCFRLTWALPLPDVSYNLKNGQEGYILFKNACWRKAIPNFSSSFCMLGFLLSNLLFIHDS